MTLRIGGEVLIREWQENRISSLSSGFVRHCRGVGAAARDQLRVSWRGWTSTSAHPNAAYNKKEWRCFVSNLRRAGLG